MTLFPHANVRPIQKDMVDSVSEALAKKKYLFAHAPTGIGKTAAALAPAIKFAKENDMRILFLTPRHSQHRIVLETVKKINHRHQANISITDLIGKKWMCAVDHVETMSGQDFRAYCEAVKEQEVCPFYNATLKNLELSDHARKLHGIHMNNPLHAEEFKALMKKERVCPYEMTMVKGRYSDIIIADYFHIFQPAVRKLMESRLNLKWTETILIIDEAHNLPERVRSLLSHQTTTFQWERAVKEAERMGFDKTADLLSDILRTWKSDLKFKLGRNPEVLVTKNRVLENMQTTVNLEQLRERLTDVAEETREMKKRSFCGGIERFLDAWTSKDEGFVRTVSEIYSRNGTKGIQIKYQNLDPQEAIGPVLAESAGGVLMSGTLSPLAMYMDLCGIPKERAIAKQYPSPFKEENRRVIIVNALTTRYSQRAEDQFAKWRWYVQQSMNAIPGNVGVFFPSYKIQKQVLEDIRTEKTLLIESPKLKKEEKVDFLRRMSEKNDHVLCAVIGGSFDQGVDFPGDMMNGVIILGLPLQRPDLEIKSLIEHYEKRYRKGWYYAYTYPAMHRTLQAAGRCIRSETDRGVIVLLDERYTWGQYRACLPMEDKPIISRAPWIQIEDFFNTPQTTQTTDQKEKNGA